MGRRPTDATWEGAPAGLVRVLVECPPAGSPTVAAEVIRRAGYLVRVCEGPDRRHPCPMVRGEGCPLVDEADVVVNLMNSDTFRRQEVLGAVTARRHPPAVVAEVAEPALQRRRLSGHPGFDPDRVMVVQSPMNRERLLGSLREVLRHLQPDTPMWGDGFC